MLVVLIAVLGTGLLVGSTALGLLYPVTGYDALAVFAPMGVFLWRDGDLTSLLNRSPGYWPLAHPGAAQLWFGLLLTIGGERLADLGQVPFAFLGSAGVATLARRLGLSVRVSALSAAAFLLTPMVVAQSRMQLNDVIGGALLVATAALAAAPAATWRSDRAVAIGLGLGLVVTTRLSELPAAAAIGLFVAIAIVHTGMRASRRLSFVVHCMGGLVVAIMLVGSAWWIRNSVLYANPLYPAAIPFLGHGIAQNTFLAKDAEFVSGSGLGAWALYPLVEPHNEVSGFGALFIVAAVPGFAWAIVHAPRQPMLICGLVMLALLPAWWLLSQHEPRFLLGAVGLIYACMPWSLVALRGQGRRWGAILLGVAATFSAVVTLNDTLLVNVFEPNMRPTYYDHDWAVDPSVASLPPDEGLLLNTGYSWIDYAAFYPLLGRRLSRTVLVVDADTLEDIVARMRAAHIRYVYVVASTTAQPLIEAKYVSPFALVQTSSVEIRREMLQRSLYSLNP